MFKNLIFCLILFFTINGGAIAQLDNKQAEVFMLEIGDKVITLLTDKSISNQERANQFREILSTKFNVKAIGKFVLGRYWKQANEQEKQRFLELFTETTVASYATRFKDYTSEKFEVIGSRAEGDGGVTVLTRIVRPNGQDIPIDWKIFEKNGEMRIYDVILEGISMGITQRSEYASVIQQGGGKVHAINTALEKKLSSYTTTFSSPLQK
ncbi:MAG: ABC transporter substrate-binding protein [Alphaproteobacteria bacterium]|nr:ABC transporter substrate-binding protein [Alphaproteobacteria bacterium]